MLRSSPFIFFEALKYALPASIFFFKFLEWWYSADNPRRRRGGGGNRGGGGAAGTANAGEGAEAGGGTAPEQGGFGTNVPVFGPPSVLMPSEGGVLHLKTQGFSDPKVPIKFAPDLSFEQEKGGRGVLLHNSCPLCGRTPIANPCMLPTGYVFCYTCAHEYMEEHEECPVTKERIIGGKASIRRVLG